MDDVEKANYKMMFLQSHKIAEQAREDVRIVKSLLETICNDQNDIYRYKAGEALCKIREREFDRQKNYKFNNDIDSKLKEVAKIEQLLIEIDIPRVIRIVEMWNPANKDLIPFKERQIELLEDLEKSITKGF